MGDFSSGWRETIDYNLEVLSNCTIITKEMITRLTNHQLITSIQKDNLVNPSNPNHKPATTLYIRIAKQWTDADFEKFKLVLSETSNTSALKILTHDSIPRKQVSGLAACRSYAGTPGNPLEETTQQEETETEDLLSKNETKLSKNFPVVRKPTDMNEISAVYETELLSEVRQLKEKSATEEHKLKNLKRKFKELQKSNAEELRLKTTEADEFRTLLNKLKSETATIRSSLEKNCKCFEQLYTKNVVRNNQTQTQVDEMTVTIDTQLWTLEDKPKFEIEKALNHHLNLSNNKRFVTIQILGNWFIIELFGRNNTPLNSCNSMEYTFARIGNIIKYTQSYLLKSSTKKRIINLEMTAASQTPHIWNFKGNSNYTWVKTDYHSYAILVYAKDSSGASYNYLYILSRKQSLPPETLEMLQNVAVKFGFRKTSGKLVQYSS